MFTSLSCAGCSTLDPLDGPRSCPRRPAHVAQVRIPLPEVRQTGSVAQNPRLHSRLRPVGQSRSRRSDALSAGHVCLLQAPVGQRQAEGRVGAATKLCARNPSAQVSQLYLSTVSACTINTSDP